MTHLETYSDGAEIEPRRIFIASESALGHRNGVSNSILKLLPEFRELGHEVMVMCPKPAEQSYEMYPVVKTPKITLPGFDFNLGAPTRASVEAHMRAFRPDVLYAASPFGFLGGFAVRAANRLELPIVANYQTRLEMYGNNFAKEIFKDKTLQDTAVDGFGKNVKKRTKRIYNNSTLALVPSSASHDDLVRYGVHTPIRHWGRGVDSQQFHPDLKQSRAVVEQKQEWAGAHERPIALYVGRLAPEKRVERLKVLEGLDVQLVIVGKGDAAREKMLKDTLPKGTIFTGQLVGDELARAYAAADFFVHTGTEETFGQTLQEAMASGLSVIAPAAGGPLDIVHHGSTGLLYEPEDDAALRSSVIRLLDDETLRTRMGAEGRRAVEDKTWRKFAIELDGHFSEAIALHSLARQEVYIGSSN